MVKNLAGGIQTTDVIKLLEEIKDEDTKLKMKKYLQIFKDSVNYEPNLALDVFNTLDNQGRTSIFFDLHYNIGQLLENVTRFYCDENVPIEIRNIVYKAMLFHYHIYSGLDYYNHDTTGLERIVERLISN